MPIPARADLRDELHCLSHDGQVVITAQRWIDPRSAASRPRSWLRLVRNGHARQDVSFTGRRAHADLEARWADLAEKYAPTALAEDQMWAKLRELTGFGQTECLATDCSGRMPSGWLLCPVCGKHARRVSQGGMTRAIGRGIIVVQAGGLRTPADPS